MTQVLSKGMDAIHLIYFKNRSILTPFLKHQIRFPALQHLLFRDIFCAKKQNSKTHKMEGLVFPTAMKRPFQLHFGMKQKNLRVNKNSLSVLVALAHPRWLARARLSPERDLNAEESSTNEPHEQISVFIGTFFSRRTRGSNPGPLEIVISQ